MHGQRSNIELHSFKAPAAGLEPASFLVNSQAHSPGLLDGIEASVYPPEARVTTLVVGQAVGAEQPELLEYQIASAMSRRTVPMQSKQVQLSKCESLEMSGPGLPTRKARLLPLGMVYSYNSSIHHITD